MPFFERQGIQFAYIKRNQLFFVFTSASRKIIPALALELLGTIVGRIHDFCGILEEENLRTNFVLIYELIDEIIVSQPLETHMLIVSLVAHSNLIPFFVSIGLWPPSDHGLRTVEKLCDLRG